MLELSGSLVKRVVVTMVRKGDMELRVSVILSGNPLTKSRRHGLSLLVNHAVDSSFMMSIQYATCMRSALRIREFSHSRKHPNDADCSHVASARLHHSLHNSGFASAQLCNPQLSSRS